MSGKFITLEGGEGVGKSTNLEYIASWLKARDIAYITTREPGGSVFSEAVRALILSPAANDIDPEAELLTMFAARAEHVAKTIKPALKEGVCVICDRFVDASYAYQGGGRGVDWARIQTLEAWLLEDFAPDATILLDAPVALGMARATKRGALDRFEREQQAFFHRVHAAYHRRACECAPRFHIVNASNALNVVKRDIGSVLARVFGVQ